MRELGFLALASLLLAATPACAGILFSDDFEQEPIANPTTSLTKWTVTKGSVDVGSFSAFGFNCAGEGGSGVCVDLDGSTQSAADMVSTPINLQPGTYSLTYRLSGNQRSGKDTVFVYFNDVQLRRVALKSTAPFKLYTDTIVVDANTTGSIRFKHLGGDDIGIILDDVTLATSDETVISGVASVAYDVTCKNLGTGAQVTRSFQSLQTWDCLAMGLAISAGEKFEATVSGRFK